MWRRIMKGNSLDSIDNEDEPQLYNFKVNVKWTGTIASFDIVAESEQEAILVANKKLDMESNGLIHFETEKRQ